MILDMEEMFSKPIKYITFVCNYGDHYSWKTTKDKRKYT